MYRLSTQPGITWSLQGPFGDQYVLHGHIGIAGLNTDAEYWLDKEALEDDSDASIEMAKARMSWLIHDHWERRDG